jgi:hypothetical protein
MVTSQCNCMNGMCSRHVVFCSSNARLHCRPFAAHAELFQHQALLPFFSFGIVSLKTICPRNLIMVKWSTCVFMLLAAKAAGHRTHEVLDAEATGPKKSKRSKYAGERGFDHAQLQMVTQKAFLSNPRAPMCVQVTPMKPGEEMVFQLKEYAQTRVVQMFATAWNLKMIQKNGQDLERPLFIGEQKTYTVFSAVTNWYMWDGWNKHVSNLKKANPNARWTHITAKNGKPYYTIDMWRNEPNEKFGICRGKGLKGSLFKPSNAPCQKGNPTLYLVASTNYVGSQHQAAPSPEDNKVTFSDKDGVEKATAVAYHDSMDYHKKDATHKHRTRYWTITTKDSADVMAIANTLQFMVFGQTKAGQTGGMDKTEWKHDQFW